MPNSPSFHHKSIIADSKENYNEILEVKTPETNQLATGFWSEPNKL